MTLKFDGRPWKNKRIPHLRYFKLCASFHSHLWILTGVTVRERPFWVKIDSLLSRVTLTFDRLPGKTIGHLSLFTSRCVHHFVVIGKFKLELQSENAQFVSNRRFFVPCDLKNWRMTSKNNSSTLLCYFKLCASFYSHMWIQIGVTVRKRLNWVFISVALTFDLRPWPLACTSLLSMVITPENVMILRWHEHCEKGVTDIQTDRQTERSVLRAFWLQLKPQLGQVCTCCSNHKEWSLDALWPG